MGSEAGVIIWNYYSVHKCIVVKSPAHRRSGDLFLPVPLSIRLSYHCKQGIIISICDSRLYARLSFRLFFKMPIPPTAFNRFNQIR